jgi:hypothetical protein
VREVREEVPPYTEEEPPGPEPVREEEEVPVEDRFEDLKEILEEQRLIEERHVE